MSTFNFEISLPDRWFPSTFTPLLSRYGSFKNWANKAWEIEVIQFCPDTLVKLEIDLDFKGSDHAGPRIVMVLLGLSIEAKIYDSRHWFHEENRWFNPGEEEAHWKAIDDEVADEASAEAETQAHPS